MGSHGNFRINTLESTGNPVSASIILSLTKDVVFFVLFLFATVQRHSGTS